ncbi:MAG: hypothetical protein D8M57_13280 [Candidatus Scalindua sp. AMX11]|nr:MAG: hypothetical protein DWQ00_11810 [Candidatus Scalindua sp.]NOG83752.1 hypothetical protein [Planctomycetota bacterium]RZV82911.1 MAG: hypothetical protein EX341_08965 [Candidatus Scalindua sp. SCAELEC01]TDE64467.1 MAG: hypothetical protein D8M57_13280 [Candidatus Scalindua sp. AMX11]GJQ59796.1 MAG: hypothetical protein SCALA701_25970 [Candidatus Scalindua sp.]
MAGMDNLISSLGTTIDYSNFAEEVIINSENKSGNNFSLYNVTNKNGVTFQNVPGGSGIQNRGFLGFIGGDRGRPAVISATVKTNNTTSSASAPSWPTVDIT